MAMLSQRNGQRRDGNGPSNFDVVGKVISYSEDKTSVRVEIVSFDPSSKMHGKVADISLKEIDFQGTGKESRRPEIKDFANGKSPMPKTKPGQLIFFTQCSFPQNKGGASAKKPEGVDYTLEARWPNFVKQDVDQSEEFAVITKPNPDVEDYRVTTFDMDNVQEIATSDLPAVIVKHVADSVERNRNPAMLINVIDENGDVSGALFKRSFLQRQEDGSYEAPDNVQELMQAVQREIESSLYKEAFRAAAGYQVALGTTYIGTRKADPTKDKALGNAIRRLIGNGEALNGARSLISFVDTKKDDEQEDDGRPAGKIVTQMIPLRARMDPVSMLAQSGPVPRDIAPGLDGKKSTSQADNAASSALGDGVEEPENHDETAGLFDDAGEGAAATQAAGNAPSRKNLGMK